MASMCQNLYIFCFCFWPLEQPNNVVKLRRVTIPMAAFFPTWLTELSANKVDYCLIDKNKITLQTKSRNIALKKWSETTTEKVLIRNLIYLKDILPWHWTVLKEPSSSHSGLKCPTILDWLFKSPSWRCNMHAVWLHKETRLEEKIEFQYVIRNTHIYI